ncbi:hypothetical protein PGT21_020209 [Puccinia graminis f. sp. tritici]|uniref:Uncharacterized protein n=1 Tax=Puccinia graminis f. sp. tritici TaxID=56615 RepID=A0A5B0QIS6_PUCGR|nr:hypothetical protein PGT21_020209 [Puccinia graminis f. sp. tritici]
MRIEAFNDRLITLLSAFAMRPRGQPTSVGQLVYSGCVNDDLKKTNVEVNPIHYHHYPFGDGKWMPGSSGFVGKTSKAWYNCAYSQSRDNSDTYICSDCK